jgi:hypothetical protein
MLHNVALLLLLVREGPIDLYEIEHFPEILICSFRGLSLRTHVPLEAHEFMR